MRKRLPKTVQTDDIKKLLKQPNRKCPTGSRNYCIILLMWRAGLRVSEITDLLLNQIDWKGERIRVIGKEDKERFVPLETWILDTLTAWKNVRPKSKYFFCTLEGSQLQRRYLNSMLERYSKKAEIEHVNPHSLRHTFATELLNDNCNIMQLKELLGHASATTTAIYLHTNPVELTAKIKAGKQPDSEG
ncbi:MAG TPA: tyrosine-type recombinase/integrase [Desulfitobacteriaceae bacterium]|nr:tyrosine-type recombinase/integrase [Desulfitobacteriaceae bacterium]